MKIVQLSGGVGGARLARGFAAHSDVELTVVVNVGDDSHNHGLHISPDIDTVIYALAGIEGPNGWGRAGDTFALNEELARFGVDNTFQLGDRDLALKLYRTHALSSGAALSSVTRTVSRSFGVEAVVLGVTDDPLRTSVRVADGWIGFQEYFVTRRHQDEVLELRFDGADRARPAPGVIESIEGADRVVIGPSNPPLSIWPILAVDGVRDAVARHPTVVAVSPLVGGKTVRGPADRVMASLGLPPGNAGVAAAYDGLIDRLVIDTSDGDDAGSIEGIDVTVTDTLIGDPEAGTRLAGELVAG
ncbi:MAG TPA: 2-phospho-L-lactate transferase [Acidimicrobiia bacterium]|nr:2-phospho-L-lactate transferase [Acidimicrobiia bacterium]